MTAVRIEAVINEPSGILRQQIERNESRKVARIKEPASTDGDHALPAQIEHANPEAVRTAVLVEHEAVIMPRRDDFEAYVWIPQQEDISIEAYAMAPIDDGAHTCKLARNPSHFTDEDAVFVDLNAIDLDVD